MGQQSNAKLIRRKIRQEITPIYRAIGNLAQALHQHLQAEQPKPEQGKDSEGAAKEANAVDNGPAK